MGVLDRAARRQANGETFALATVVRTLSVTAAKAGAKALITPEGNIEEGWIGGGCARAAVLKAARQSMIDGQSRLISIAPKDLLADLGVAPGEVSAGVVYAQNSCPSQGTMDIFIEPVLPAPRLLILGASPVAVALASLAPHMGFAVTVSAPAPDLGKFAGRVSDSGEGRWTIAAAIDESIPVPVLSAALYERFSSRGGDDFAEKVLSALRHGFGGHEEKAAVKGRA